MNDEEIKAKLRTLTRAQRDAYTDMMNARPGEWRWASQHGRRWETLEAVVNAGLAEWRSAFPEADESYQHYMVPVGTPTYSQLKEQRRLAAEAALTIRAQRVINRAFRNGDRFLPLVREIIRELS